MEDLLKTKVKNYLIIKQLQTYNRSVFTGMSWEEKLKLP
jgi:hypothetical protein